MEAILTLQKAHLHSWQQAAHASYLQQRQHDATILLALHYSHSTHLLLAATHHGTLHIFPAATFLPPPPASRQPQPSAASLPAHQGPVGCMASDGDRLVTGGDDAMHVWSLAELAAFAASAGSSARPAPLLAVTAPQYRLAGRALTAVPRTLSVLMLPSSDLLVSSHSNHHVIVTDCRNSRTVADLTCASSSASALGPAVSLPLLFMPQPYHVLLVGGADGYIRVYDCDSWQLTATYDITANTAIPTTRTSLPLPSRPAIIALSPATASPSAPASLLLCLTASPAVHAFYYPSLTALPALPLSQPAAQLHASLLLGGGGVRRVCVEPLRVEAVKVAAAGAGAGGGGAGGVCCVRYGERGGVDDVVFVGGSGPRIDVLGCLGSVDMGSLQCR